MLTECTQYLFMLARKTPSTIPNYKRFRHELQQRIESNLYRDPMIWKYSLSEISYLVEKYIKNYYDVDEECKYLCEEFKHLVEKAK